MDDSVEGHGCSPVHRGQRPAVDVEPDHSSQRVFVGYHRGDSTIDKKRGEALGDLW